MTDRELDALAVEKVLGNLGNGYGPISGDDELALLLEDQMEDRGLIEKYINELTDIVKADFSMHAQDTAFEVNVWLLIRATPAQRRDAALKATGNL